MCLSRENMALSTKVSIIFAYFACFLMEFFASYHDYEFVLYFGLDVVIFVS